MIKTLTKISLCAVATLSLSACIMAPLSNSVTARSSGDGHSTTNVGYIHPSSLYLRQSYGVSKNLDIGVLVETGVNSIIGLNAQYSFINHPHGISLAALGGAGYGSVSNDNSDDDNTSDTTSGYYFTAGGIISYKADIFEPYFVARYNHMSLKNKLKIDNVGGSGNTLAANNYYQLAAGATFWANDTIGLTANYTYILQPNHQDCSQECSSNIGLVVLGIVARY
jgi:hypothetical protein